MNIEWKYLNFEDCLDKFPRYSKIAKNKFLIEGEYPIISQEKDYINGYWNEEKDVIKIAKPVVIFGDHSKVVKLIDFDFVAGADGVKIFQPIKEINAKYLFYFLQNVKLDDLGYARHYRLLKQKYVPIPSLPIQHQIVEKLDAAFEAIDRAKANLEKNIQNAKELFQSKLNELFLQKGEGYEECKLQDVLLKTKNINPKDFEEREYKYVDVSAVNRNSLKIEEFIYINAVNAPSRARKQIFENDIIFATVRPTLKRVCVISDEFDNEICSTGYVVLRSNQKIIIPKIIFYFLQTAKFMNSMEKLQKGASYPAVTDGEVKSQIIIFSKSLETQQKIVAQLDQLSAQTESLQQKYTQKLQNLEELRKSILEKAFKGELTN